MGEPRNTNKGTPEHSIKQPSPLLTASKDYPDLQPEKERVWEQTLWVPRPSHTQWDNNVGSN